LKGRSAGQRHTDRQTNLAENNCPSGLQSVQKQTEKNRRTHAENIQELNHTKQNMVQISPSSVHSQTLPVQLADRSVSSSI